MRLNSGRHFAKPCQSNYAMARQFLTANPGIPYSSIEKYLRDSEVTGGSTIGRMHSLQGTLSDDSGASIQRQCPECAWALYHSSYYHYSWLTQCPIHRTALTTECPSCHQKWPQVSELPLRDCPHCGLPQIHELKAEALDPNDADKYHPMERIRRFFETQEGHDAAIYGGRIFTNDYSAAFTEALRAYSRNSAFFPFFQKRYQEQLTEQECFEMPLTWHSINEITADLIPCDIHRPIYSSEKRDYDSLDESSLPDWMYEIEYKVFHHVLDWVKRNTDSTHQIYIRSYRHVHLQHFDVPEEFCPFCYALSMWFYVINIVKYGERYRMTYDDFPIMRLSMFPSLIIPCEPVISSHQRFYMASDCFSRWFYEYCLELCFVQLFDFTLRFKDWLRNRYRQGSAFINTFGWEENLECLRYYSFIKEGKFSFFYKYASPLEDYNNPKGCADGCEAFELYYRSLIIESREPDFVINIRGHKLTKKRFAIMRRKFKTFIANHFTKWAAGHCPYPL